MVRIQSIIATVAVGFSFMAALHSAPNANAQTLVHRWSFNNDYLDSSGSGNHGTTAGAPTFVSGRYGQAASISSATFDGVHLDFGASNLPLAATDSWSMNVWVNLTAPLGSLEHIAGFSLDNGFLGAVDNGRGRSFTSQSGVDNNDFYFWGANADRASGVDYASDGAWHMYTISYDGTNLRMYKDASLLVTAAPAPNAFQLAYDEVHVGNPSQWNNNFDGLVDEFSIFSGALSEGQIGGLFINNDFTQQAFLNPVFTVNRNTGEIILTNDSSFPIEVLGYTIASPSGSLKPVDWETIAGRYDDAGDGTIDPNNSWEVLTNTNQTFSVELSEGVPGTDGGTIAVGKVINFGAAWAGNPVEDLTIELLLNDGLGTIKTLPAEFIGNGGNRFAKGDLDSDGDVDSSDWQLFRSASAASLSGATATQAYLGGDFDGDFDKDIFDFDQFVAAYDAVNGGGAFASMLAVPEPASIVLLAVPLGMMLCCRKSHGRIVCATLAIGCLTHFANRSEASLVSLYQFNGNGAETTGSNVNLSLVGDAGFAPSLHPGLGRALSLDGDGDGALGADFVKIQTSDATVVAWVYATSLDGTFDSIVKQWGDVRGQFHFGLGGGSPAGSLNLLQNEYGRTGSASTTLTTVTPDPFPTDQWVHVAFTLDSANGLHRLYVNGDVVASAAYAPSDLLGNKTTGGNPRGIGIGLKPSTAGTAPSAGAPGYWNGYIDEVGIYDHALSEADIEQVIANSQIGMQLDGTSVPEPTALAMASLACLVALGARRRCRKAGLAVMISLATCGALVGASSAQAAVNAYYPFNGNANEDTGININLNLVGDAHFGGSLHPGLGTALSLDGNGDGAIGQDYVKIQTDNASAVAWVYATSAEGTWDSIIKQWGDVRGQFHFGLGGGTPAGTGDFLQNEYATAQNTSVSLTAPATFPLNQWVHVAFVLDAAAGQHRLYLNGDQVASAAYAGTLANKTTGATGLGIGVKPNTAGTAVSAGAAGYWNGSIDEVAIFNHALTELDVEEIMANALNGVQVDGTTNPYIRLQVNRTSGEIALINDSPGSVDISAYQISSPAGRLRPSNLDNIAGNPGFPTGIGTGNGWETDGANNSMQILETFFAGTSNVGNGVEIPLGDVFASGGAEDLIFQYRNSTGGIVSSIVEYVGAAAVSADFDSDGDVDGNDFLIWQRGFGLTGQTSKVNGDANGDGSVTGADLGIWKSTFGSPGGLSAASAVPEPATAQMLLAVGAALATACQRQKLARTHSAIWRSEV